MCSAVFTSTNGSRGGFGEIIVFKQIFLRWNFFFANGIWNNMAHIIGSWKLGWCEPGTKLFVFQEERVGWGVLLIYYMPYKVILTAVNVASCYWAIFKYGRYATPKSLSMKMPLRLFFAWKR
ncbi:hypothetical protein QQZ08_002541 [Neonectria magnoliae]|uniref:Uncharacterized protein n=1 Tax=Neonectria magnoliae TaxID=2732573 RepID=A0ABR1IDX1_9HYPO